jgi:hypothetical protein
MLMKTSLNRCIGSQKPRALTTEFKKEAANASKNCWGVEQVYYSHVVGNEAPVKQQPFLARKRSILESL